MALEELRVADMQGLELVRIEAPWAARLRVVQFQRCWALRAMHLNSQDLERVSVISCTYIGASVCRVNIGTDIKRELVMFDLYPSFPDQKY